MHKFLKLSFFTLIFFWTIPNDSKSLDGLYFSERLPTENGYLILGIEIFTEKGKSFYNAQELRFQNSRGWEEVLFVGKITKVGDETLLVPEACQIRATEVWGKKMALLRRFDCDHLEFRLGLLSSGKFFLSESLLGTKKEVVLPYVLNQSVGNPVAVRFEASEMSTEGIWGFHLNGLGGKDPEWTWNPSKLRWEPFQGYKTGDGLQFYRWKRTFSN
ncbi:hypothetical protein ND861_10075 [Leptospira sp. 2 VSF19]|uniref:Uncharacterized protein n=1 Tax=Leptospira soteropolitanensis TaxID=2950025 RepID=A0AAW5VFU9_9LEPT|nr:hypothetical protein [Leptospira soteropolitanensis]MCW7492445.1 hypothetical protein [Leptospira soteropolitanensis]MCW7500496.1 hypothetical protein [Leptospira soteropolitanensis]MCW7522834.1 hypothetical protein [Leptospira soteropolitanensis]MCW7526693.1 hypothetical protein [Leptospira soteropolitanensis]MCW7530466.1 hypothetical protein [Leptospira soteropolitanensis]